MPTHILATEPTALDSIRLTNPGDFAAVVTVHDAADDSDLGAPVYTLTVSELSTANLFAQPARPFAVGVTLASDFPVDVSTSIASRVSLT